MNSPAIEVLGITVRYGRTLALDRVTVLVQPGRICALIGTNGSGKSSLFKAIMDIVKPDDGIIRLAGGKPAGVRRAGLVGYVPQSEDVDWSFPLRVRDVVMMGRYGLMDFARRPSTTDVLAVDQALTRVELIDKADRQIGQLSGGERKRAFVARGLAQDASILLLDEPFAGVDKRSEVTISAVLRELADTGRTVLVSTHDLGALYGLADEAVLLMNRVIVHDRPEVVLQPHYLAEAFGLRMRRVDDPIPGGPLAGEHPAPEQAPPEQPQARTSDERAPDQSAPDGAVAADPPPTTEDGDPT